MPRRLQGILLVLTSASLWGLSGTVAQILFARFGFSPLLLVTVRLWGSGLILVLALLGSGRSLRVARRDLGRLLIFGLFGFFLVQFAYFAAIALVGVAMATFLQYVGPSLIAAWVILRERRPPTMAESLALALALGGTLLLVLGRGTIRLQPLGLVFGILSAFSLAFYTLYPRDLVRRLGAFVTTAYGFLFGATASSLLWPLWQGSAINLTPASLLLVLFVVVLGTLLPFAFYILALTRLDPTAVGVAATGEPLSAALSAYLVLGQALQALQYVGGALILGAMLALALSSGRSPARRGEPTQVAAGGRPDL